MHTALPAHFKRDTTAELAGSGLNRLLVLSVLAGIAPYLDKKGSVRSPVQLMSSPAEPACSVRVSPLHDPQILALQTEIGPLGSSADLCCAAGENWCPESWT